MCPRALKFNVFHFSLLPPLPTPSLSTLSAIRHALCSSGNIFLSSRRPSDVSSFLLFSIISSALTPPKQLFPDDGRCKSFKLWLLCVYVCANVDLCLPEKEQIFFAGSNSPNESFLNCSSWIMMSKWASEQATREKERKSRFIFSSSDQLIVPPERERKASPVRRSNKRRAAQRGGDAKLKTFYLISC